MKYTQSPHALLMIRPAAFGFNNQTSASNTFQHNDRVASPSIQHAAIHEFDRMVDVLLSHEIDVKVFSDNDAIVKPDAIFPNNWISFHENGTVILYPMMAENRRWERRPDIIEKLRADFVIRNIVDLSDEESHGKFLEGTGSLVFDHIYRKMYACRSPRTNEDLVRHLAEVLNYEYIVFNAVDENQQSIYHTNVMMCIGEKFVVVCLDAITSEDDQDALLESFSSTDRKVIAISYAQLRAFAGNMISVKNTHGDSVVLLSVRAFQSLLPGQLNAIGEAAELLPLNVDIIENIGGGSVRCMVAGIHLPKSN